MAGRDVFLYDANLLMKVPGRIRISIAAAGVLAVLAAGFLLFAPFDDGGNGRRDAVHYGGSARDALEIVAVVDGVEITAAHWTAGELQRQQTFDYFTSGNAAQVADSGGFAALNAALEALLSRYDPDTVILAGVLMDAVLLAEIDRRDLHPSPSEIERGIRTSRELMERTEVTTQAGGIDQIGLLILPGLSQQALLANVGEETYRAVLEPAQWHLALGVQALAQEVRLDASSRGVSGPAVADAWTEFRLDLVRNADIELLGEQTRRLSLEEALRYLEEFASIMP